MKINANNDFFTRVYEVTKLVPYGRITSYGAIARFLGSGSMHATIIQILCRHTGWLTAMDFLQENTISETPQPWNNFLPMKVLLLKMTALLISKKNSGILSLNCRNYQLKVL